MTAQGKDRKYIAELLRECFQTTRNGSLEWSFEDGFPLEEVVSLECVAYLLDVFRSTERESCCDKWREATGQVLSTSPLAMAYPAGMRPDAQIEYMSEDGGSWNVNGCCGGGCYVLHDLEFCPWCGSKLARPTETDCSDETADD